MKQQVKPQKRRKHDATFWRDGAYLERPYWYWGSGTPKARAGWKRTASWLSVILTAYGWATHRTTTEWALVLILSPAAGVLLVLGFRRWEEWEHYRTKVKPLAWALEPVLDQPATEARSWLHVPIGYAADPETEIVIDVPDPFTGADRDMEDVTRAITAKLGIPNPRAERKLGGRQPRLVFTHQRPPPESVSLADIRPHIEAAKPSQVILGLAAKSQVTDLDLDDETPHAGASIETGGGKSELAKNAAVQVLYHGGIVMILDYKLVSHMWADGLPNVCYARTPAEIHEALMWLGWDEYDEDGNVTRPSELTRRKRVVLAATRNREQAELTRLLIVAEERNATTRILKRHWRRIGGKGASPALEALDETGETGRQICINVLHIAQRLSAKASGSDGSRDAMENIGAIITKDPPEQTWKLLASGHTQPPRSGHPGRYQLIRSQGVLEYQGVLYDRDKDQSDAMARELAMAGTIGQPRSDMPFVNHGPLLVPAVVGQDAFTRQGGSEQGFVVGQDAPVLPAGEGPARAVTLAAAAAAGLFASKAAARKVAQRQGWEPVGGDKVAGYEYALTDIYAYINGRGRG